MSLHLLTDALECAVQTALHQRSEVPVQPQGWLLRAQEALAVDDAEKIAQFACEINDAHIGYKSSWDCRAWLDELRDAVREYRKTLKKEMI